MTNNKTFPWIDLTTTDQLNVITTESNKKPIVLFKNSTRCSISKKVLQNFEKEYTSDNSLANFYYLDLLAYREVSNAITKKFEIEHQSPQVLVIYDEEVLHDASHSDIQASEVSEILSDI